MPKKRSSIGIRAMESLTSLSYGQLFSLWLSLAVIFAFGYFVLEIYFPQHAPQELQGLSPASKLFNSLYFSIITATSTGYGDITPYGFSKALASLQSILALMVFAIFVTKLVQHRQEIALQEVHRLTFEDVFHNTREGLWIIRKDCDRIMQDAEEHKSLNDDHWADLVIAYQQAQSLLQEIPDFYADDKKLYTIDKRRELLLHEAVTRTLKRINTMLDHLSAHGVDWTKHSESMQELHGLIRIVHEITPLWEKGSPHCEPEAFEDIMDLATVMHGSIEKTIQS